MDQHALRHLADRHVGDLHLPVEVRGTPGGQLLRRMLFGVFLVVAVATLAYLDRGGYNDSSDGTVDLLDAVYYATVSITTTGYGDVVPVSDRARAVTTILVTPARIAFLVLLVGTSVELIASATRSGLRQRIWRSRMHDHVVILGYGVTGKAAALSLAQQQVRPERVVIVDRDRAAVDAGLRDGFAGIVGDMSSNRVLLEAGVDRADTVLIAPNRDDTAVLATLSVRAINGDVRVVATARELENAPLLRRSGADMVLTSSGSTGQMLGLATTSPHAVAVIEDLLEVGRGFDLVEREVSAAEAGPLQNHARADELVVAVYRGDEIVTRSPRGDTDLQTGDRIVSLVSRPV